MNEIRRDDICIDYPGGKNDINKEKKVITYPCHGEKGNQEWIYHHNTVKTKFFFFEIHFLSTLILS